MITDPRTLGMAYPSFKQPRTIRLNTEMLVPPASENASIELEKGPNIKPLPTLEPLPDQLEGPVLLKVADNISTDEIMPAGATALPYRSNIPEISKFSFSRIDGTYYERAMKYRKQGSFVVGGANYGQGSSREHAALGPRYLGLKAVIAKSFARIHLQNLSNFGILPLTFVNPGDREEIAQGDVLSIPDVRKAIQKGNRVKVVNLTQNKIYEIESPMTPRQVEMVLAGSLINRVRQKRLEW